GIDVGKHNSIRLRYEGIGRRTVPLSWGKVSCPIRCKDILKWEKFRLCSRYPTSKCGVALHDRVGIRSRSPANRRVRRNVRVVFNDDVILRTLREIKGSRNRRGHDHIGRHVDRQTILWDRSQHVKVIEALQYRIVLPQWI